MRLSTLLKGILPVDPSLDGEIKGLAQDSRLIEPGSLFLACAGRTFDGRQYTAEAIAKGAVAVLAEGEGQAESREQIPHLFLPKLTQHLPVIAAQFFNHPVTQLQVIGVTGTNGKTSTSHFIAQSLQSLRLSCGLIGTLGSGLLGALKETLMTTPDTVTLQKILHELVSEQASHVAMEVSSHSLDQDRIKGLVFEVGIFTNLTQDHLDYHGDMQTYGAAKKRFFTDFPMRYAVINEDDAFGRELIAALPSDKRVAYGYINPCLEKANGKFVYALNPHFDLSGIRAKVSTSWGEGQLYSPLVGEFNLSNILGVLAALCALGIPLADALLCLHRLQPVPGRMQMFGGGQRPSVVVDYAHTPDALEKALRALRLHCQGKLYCLFGCGGDRDKGKRPLMGAIAEQYADVVMLTDDNPRHENGDAIIAGIAAGLKCPQQVRIQRNRSQAIQDIIQYAGPGDYVLIAGKGAENYQQFGDEKLPFSDAAKISEIVEG